jgi:hypothetical protein
MEQPRDPLAGRNYRIRRIIIRLDVDVYDDQGFLLDRTVSDDIAMNEAAFPPQMVAALANATGMGRGFAQRTTTPTLVPEPTPSPVS